MSILFYLRTFYYQIATTVNNISGNFEIVSALFGQIFRKICLNTKYGSDQESVQHFKCSS